MAGRDKRRAYKALRTAGCPSDGKQGYGYKKYQSDKIKVLQAQVAALVKARSVSTKEDTPLAM